jgi:hypothetical protein
MQCMVEDGRALMKLLKIELGDGVWFEIKGDAESGAWTEWKLNHHLFNLGWWIWFCLLMMVIEMFIFFYTNSF